MSEGLRLPDFPDLDERELLALFVLGFVLGAILILAARDLMREHVALEDQAARRRARDFIEDLQAQAKATRPAAELSQDEPQAKPAAAELSPRAAPGPRLIAVNEDNREAATNASDAGTDVTTDRPGPQSI